MLDTGAGLWFSASDVLHWLGCAHRSSLDARALTDPVLRDWWAAHRETPTLRSFDDDDEGRTFATPAQVRGDEHERAALVRLEKQGLLAARIPRPEPFDRVGIEATVAATEAAMGAGAAVIYQAALLDAPWYGFADFLVRVDGMRSRFGDYTYEVRDTKLARRPTASALLQLAHYGALLAHQQQAAPPRLVVWLGTGEECAWPYEDAAPYLLQARQHFAAALRAATPTPPEPVNACAHCRWYEWCLAAWGADDLIHVHRLTARQRIRLRALGISTIAALAHAAPTPKPPGMATATFARLRQQAQAQTGRVGHLLVRPQRRSAGIAAVPPPAPGDLYLDLEGDPFAAIPTLDYLWAYADAQGQYHWRWAHTADDERAAFRWLMDLLLQAHAAGGDWHVYHYNTYERTALTRIAAAWPDPDQRAYWVRTVADLITARFVDLYRVVEASLRPRDGGTSLKVVEKLAGYDRAASLAGVATADDSILAYEQFLRAPSPESRRDQLAAILAYNRHDTLATQAVHHWLHGLQPALAEEDLEPDPEPYVPSPPVRQRLEATADLQARLVAAAAAATPLPSGLSPAGAVMLGHLLGWHRAESAVQFADFMRLCAWALEEAEPEEAMPAAGSDGVDAEADPDTRIAPGTEPESCLLDVELVREHPPSHRRANAVRQRDYRCRPGAWKVKAGDRVRPARGVGTGDRTPTFTLHACDPQQGTFSLRHGTVPADLGPLVLAPFAAVPSDWEALMRLGEAALSAQPDLACRVGLDLLDRRPPRPAAEMQPRPDEPAPERARRLAAAMSAGTLPVQGPPGAGKTWLGARLIADLVQRGSRTRPHAVIAVTATSHRAIDNLLAEAVARCRELHLDVTFAHVGPEAKLTAHPHVTPIAQGSELADWLADTRSRRAVVVGATKYALSRADVASGADALVIDEAGQVALADALAAVQVAPVAFALGDPQQLAAPFRAAHAASVQVSLLEHLAAGHAVLPWHAGVFLDVTYRLHEAVCAVVADLAYQGQLRPAPQASQRRLEGPAVGVGRHLLTVAPGVAWLPLDGDDDELSATLAVIDGLLGKATVTDEHGGCTPLSPAELLVVAPHNAHVNQLAARVPAGVRVGTVDKFQGQQGHVVIYSMGRLATEAAEVPFLYEINRLNVALSRARLLAVVVSQAQAAFPPVTTPGHVLLASRFIQAVSPNQRGGAGA